MRNQRNERARARALKHTHTPFFEGSRGLPVVALLPEKLCPQTQHFLVQGILPGSRFLGRSKVTHIEIF